MHIGDDSLYCPALPVLWAHRAGDTSWANTVHKAYGREIWNRRSRRERLLLVARFLSWPAVAVSATAYFTWHNGLTIRRRAGKAVSEQVLEQLVLAARHGIWPPWYYMFELYRDENRRRAGDYLLRYETKRTLYEFLKRRVEKTSGELLNNKALFAEHCTVHGLPVPETVAVLEDGKVMHELSGGSPADLRLPEADLFVKRLRGKGGRGTLKARWTDGIFELSDGMCGSAQDVVEHLLQKSRTEALLVQRSVVNHRDTRDLTAGALSCVRTMTCRNEQGGFEVTNAVFRMAMNTEATVDGLHRGGLAAKVDLATGALGPATDLGMMPGVGWCDANPHTGVKIAGRILPRWSDLLDLAVRAHAAFPWKVAVGWDIAITDDGPVLVEGNGSPCVDIIQRAEGAPLGSARFGELLAWHIERA